MPGYGRSVIRELLQGVAEFLVCALEPVATCGLTLARTIG